jgi:hypothetical protein
VNAAEKPLGYLEGAPEGGLLEQTVLTLGPGTNPGETIFLGTDNKTPVGLARWTDAEKIWGLIGPAQILGIFELEEEPLLFTLSRCWALSSKLVIHDSEGQRIGYTARNKLLDHCGFGWALFRADPARPCGSYWDLSNQWLAEITVDGPQLRMILSSSLAGDPFAKMRLVAGFLWHYEKKTFS